MNTHSEQPAFPNTWEEEREMRDAGVFFVKHETPGMTKREYFAAKAMQGYCANPHAESINDIVRWSVSAADKLIEALNVKAEQKTIAIPLDEF